MRIGAYSGVMAARIAEQHHAQERGGAATPSRSQGQQATRDPHLLAKLSGEGWLEHTTEEG